MPDFRFPPTDPRHHSRADGAGFSLVLVFIAFFALGLSVAFVVDYDHSAPKPDSRGAVAGVGAEPAVQQVSK